MNLLKIIEREYFKYAGIAIFMFGNKKVNNKTILADGVYKEFQIAKQSNAYIIPIGSTGYVARKIWNEVFLNINDYPYLKKQAKVLQDCTEPQKVIDAIISVLETIKAIF